MLDRQKSSRIGLVILALLAFIAVVPARLLASPPARDCSGGNAAILAPTAGATVFGIVQIEGTASLGSDFQYYKLEVAPTGTEAWGNLAGEARQQVVNGQLGVWDSASVADGAYTLRLRVVDPTGNYCEALVTNVLVQNTAPPTATPEVLATPTLQETEAPPVQNAVPTQLPTIQGPAGTATPEPTETPTGPTPTPAPSSGGFGGIEFDTIIASAADFGTWVARIFMFGILTMAGIVVLVGVIYFVRRVL